MGNKSSRSRSGVSKTEMIVGVYLKEENEQKHIQIRITFLEQTQIRNTQIRITFLEQIQIRITFLGFLSNLHGDSG